MEPVEIKCIVTIRKQPKKLFSTAKSSTQIRKLLTESKATRYSDNLFEIRYMSDNEPEIMQRLKHWKFTKYIKIVCEKQSGTVSTEENFDKLFDTD